MSFKEKNAIVIEGNRRLGAQASIELAKKGAKVTVLTSMADNSFSKLINKNKLNIRCIKIGKQKTSLKSGIAKAKKICKSIDIVINYLNAEKGSHYSIGKKKAVKQSWQSFFSVNLKSFNSSLETIISSMVNQKNSTIITLADTPIQGTLHYVTVRNIITATTKTLGRELAKKNIRLNAVIPGPIEGEDYSRVLRTHAAALSMYFPHFKPAKINEIVEPVLFLASKDSSYIFSETIRVDSGFAS